MPTNIIVQVPDSLRQYHSLLLDFVNTMINKLDKNSHKQTPTTASLPTIMELLQLEIDEFMEQIGEDKFNENSLVELADQANFSFLAYVALRLQGVKHAE